MIFTFGDTSSNRTKHKYTPESLLINQEKVFGYRHLTYIFVFLITISKNGFHFKRKFHKWNEIASINVWQESFGHDDSPYACNPNNAFAPRAEIILKSGKILLIKGDCLEKKDAELEKGFLTAFDELVYGLIKQYKIHRG